MYTLIDISAEPNRIQSGFILGTIEDTFFYSFLCPEKEHINHNFGEIVHDQVFAAQSQCGSFAFGENYHVKVLSDDSLSELKDYFSYGQTKKEKYNTLARQLMCASLIINNSLSSKTYIYLKEQYVVNQSNYPNTTVKAVAMITSFRNGDTGRNKGNNNTNKTPKGIVSIHLADCGSNCSKPDNDGSVASFEYTANDQGTTDDDDLLGAEALAVDSEFANDNINENIETNDDDSGNNDDDNNDATIMSGNNKKENSEREDSVPNNDNTDFTTNPANKDPLWMLLLEVADDDKDDDPGDYNEFCSNYNLDNDSVFDNDDIDQGKGHICMTINGSWFPLEEDEYEYDDILLRSGVFNVGSNPSIHPNFFNGTLNNILGYPYINDNPIFNTQVLHHALLKSLMRIQMGDVDNLIKNYDALQCKFQRIGIHNSTDYFQLDSSESL